MHRFLVVGTGVSVVIASMLFGIPARVVWAQGITPSDVEQQVRASLSVWNTDDPIRIVDTPGPGNNRGSGFGYRTRTPRAGHTREEAEQSREDELAVARTFLASVEYYRATLDEIHTAVDGDIGLAWGFFTEKFLVRGRAPEKVRVRFTTALKREAGRWRQLLFHRDAQPFDEKGHYIPVLLQRK